MGAEIIEGNCRVEGLNTNQDTQDKKNRFVLLIDDVYNGADGSMFVAGRVHGSIEVGMEVYVMNVMKETTTATIKKIEQTKMGKISEVESMTDDAAEILLENIDDIKLVKRKNVLSSVLPGAEAKLPINNPFLEAILYEKKDFFGERSNFEIIKSAITSAVYITPIQIINRDEMQGQISGELTNKQEISFLTINHHEDKNSHIFPIFTNGEEIPKQQLQEGKFTTAIMMFDDCIGHIMQSGEEGMVINPSSKNAFFMNKKIISSIKGVQQ